MVPGRSQFAAVAVVLLVLGAGCNAVFGSSEETIQNTVSPVPVTESPTATPGAEAGTEFASLSWVRADGSIDTDALVTAHRGTLTNRSFTLVLTHGVTNDSGTLSFGLLRLKADRSAARYFVRSEGVVRPLVAGIGGNVTRRYYRTGGTAYGRWDLPNETMQTGRLDPAVVPEPRTYSAGLLSRYLLSDPDDISVVERDGRRLYRVYVAPHTTREKGPWQFGGVTGYTGTYYVTGDGLVVSMTVAYDAERSDDVRRHTIRLTHRRVGETPVITPSWVFALQRNRTATATPTPSEETTPSPTATKTARTRDD